ADVVVPPDIFRRASPLRSVGDVAGGATASAQVPPPRARPRGPPSPILPDATSRARRSSRISCAFALHRVPHHLLVLLAHHCGAPQLDVFELGSVVLNPLLSADRVQQRSGTTARRWSR